ERLHKALLEQAKAERRSGFRGRALDRVAEAAAIRATPELRREAIEAITSAGVRFVKEVSADFDNYEGPAAVIVARVPEFGFKLPPYWHASIQSTQTWDSPRISGSYLLADQVPDKNLFVFLRQTAGKGPDIYLASRSGFIEHTLQELPPGFG